MAVDPKVIDKIRALLETKGRTPEEAAAYVAKANELAEKHGVTMYEVTQAGKARMAHDVRETGAMDIFEHGKPEAWRWDVLKAAAKAAGVWVMQGSRIEYTNSNKGYKRFRTAWFVGLPLDVEVAGYTYQFLVQEVERLAREHAKPAWDEIRRQAAEYGISVHEAEKGYAEWHAHPLKQQASFRKGAAYGITEALEGLTQERQTASTSTTALVVNREAVIRDYVWQKRYGYTYTEYQEKQAARAAEAEAKAALVPAKKARPFKWTKTDQRRADSAARRMAREEQARQNRYWANVDVRSWSGGREAGRAMKVRPGIKGATE